MPATTGTSTVVDFAKLSSACLVTMIYTTCFSFAKADEAINNDALAVALNVLKARGVTTPNIAVAEALHLDPDALHYVDPEKLDEDTLEDLHIHLFEDDSPEDVLCHEILGVDRDGKPLPEVTITGITA